MSINWTHISNQPYLVKHLKRKNDHVGWGDKKVLFVLKKLVLNDGASSLFTTRIHG